jgi:Flp pilus assembly pilin Flp
MVRAIVSALKDDGGQGLTEYAIILALVSVAAAGVLAVLSGAINGELGLAGSDI